MRYTIIILLLFLCNSIYAQSIIDIGEHKINNYTPADYEASTQIFSIAQDARGLMYFGNMNGLIEYDGVSWRIYELSNKSLPNALGSDKNGQIFIGGNGEIGYLTNTTNGEATYKSLMHLLPEEERNFNAIVKVLPISNVVFFLLPTKVLIYNYDTMHVFKPDLPSIYGYTAFNHLLLLKRDVGIHLYINDTIVLLPHSKQLLKGKGIYEIVEYDNENILVVTEKGGMHKYNIYNIFKTIDKNNNIRYDFEFDELIEEIPTQAHNYLLEHTLTQSVKINENLFAFGTIKGGILLTDKFGNIVGVYNKNRGINDNAIYNILVDKDKDIWVGLNYGVAHIETSVPVTSYKDQYGLDDAVLSTIEFKNKRYFGTMNGIFSIPNFSNEDLFNKPLLKNEFNTELSAWDFLILNDNLFTTGDNGIYQILPTRGKEIFEGSKAYVFKESKRFSNHIFMGLTNGLNLVKVNTTKNDFANAQMVNEFEGFNKAVRKIVNDRNGNIWVTSQYNSLYFIQFEDGPADYKIFNFDTIHGLPNPDFNYTFYIDNELFVSTEKGVYKYFGPELIKELNDTTKYFKPSEKFNLFHNKDSLLPVNIMEENDSTYWIQTDISIGKYSITKEGAVWNDSLSKVIPPAYYTFLDSNGVIWICDDRGILRFDTRIEKDLAKPYNTQIRKILLNQDSLIYNGFNCLHKDSIFYCERELSDIIEKFPVVDYEYNSIEFHYATSFYENIDKIEYKFMLEGYDDDWSDWTSGNKKEYTNLNEGKYTFKVLARNVYGSESQIASFQFKILPPIYRTFVAYFSYVLILGIVFLIGIRLNSKRLKAANIRLEKIVRKRTEEIRKQKDELEKLSIVASETDNAVIIMDSEGNIEWVNDGFTRMYGYSKNELLDIKGKNILNSSANIYINDVLKSVVRDKESIIYESMFITKKGENKWVQTTLTPILNSAGNVIKLVAIDTDIGKLKTAEEEISQQKEELQTQSELLEETNIELERTNLLITDSIKYAKLIQDAVLPNKKEVYDEFPESFIFYKPKSIVSGDFYWIAKKEDKIFLAVVDCTGHGVPGAFMSIVGSILLREIVNDKRLKNAAEILERLNNGVINALGQTGDKEEIQDDGMDMTLLIVDKKKKKINIALANHNAYLFKGKEQINIEGDIFSIGGVLSKSMNAEYTNHEYDIENGNSIYMFSDGFQDQFGGEVGKKYMATRFKYFINQIHSFSMQVQEHKIKNEFKAWQSCEKQVDDVLVIGIQFSDLG